MVYITRVTLPVGVVLTPEEAPHQAQLPSPLVRQGETLHLRGDKPLFHVVAQAAAIKVKKPMIK